MEEYPEDLKDLYMEFGRAAEIAQVMEVEAGNLALAFVALAFDPATITDDERQIFQAVAVTLVPLQSTVPASTGITCQLYDVASTASKV